MNTAYDFTESADLIQRLVGLTNDGRAPWDPHGTAPQLADDVIARYQIRVDGDLEALIWSSGTGVGFTLFEVLLEPGTAVHFDVPQGGMDPPGNLETGRGFHTISQRDIVAISIENEEGPSRGEVYANLVKLLALARRSVDTIEPTVDRAKKYIDRLAV